MVERRVQPLKQRVHLLCDYSGATDLTHEVTEELEADEAVEREAGLVGVGIVMAAGNAIEVFSVSYRPNLVSHLFPCIFLV